MLRVGLIFLAVCGLAAAADAADEGGGRQGNAQSPVTMPSAAAATGTTLDPYDRIELPRSRGEGKSAGAAASEGVFTATRVMLALGIVLGCIFALRWAGRKLLGLPAGGGGGAVQVLSTSTISPRQQLMLVRVGKRLVLVGNCGAQMNSLCEISDPDEIAGILSQVQRGAAPRGGSFLALFGKEAAPYQALSEETPEAAAISSSPEAEERTDPRLEETREELNGLLDKVRSVSRNLKRA